MAAPKDNSWGLFLREVFRRPRQLGALAPSSRALAWRMTDCCAENPGQYVLELGPGTGAITRVMLERGVPPDRLIAIEKSPTLAEHLRESFPGVHIVLGDALDMKRLVAEISPQALPLKLVISGLPLLNFPPDIARGIAAAVHDVLAPHGKMVQFSYQIAAHNSNLMAMFHLVRSRVVWFNLPPARVSVFEK